MSSKILSVALLLILLGCKNDKDEKIYSKNRVFAKKNYNNALGKIDSTDYFYKELLYARYIAKDSQIYVYDQVEIDSLKNIDEIPKIEVEELEKTYKVKVRFETTSYVLWRFLVTKGSKMINYGGNLELNTKYFEIPKESSHFNFIIENKEQTYNYNVNQFLNLKKNRYK